MWQYSQKSGTISRVTPPPFEGHGYSGYGQGRNNGAMEAVADIGPIPCGLYEIGPSYQHIHLGPIVMNLTPVAHDAHGRTLFRIHGDNATGDASHGCIIQARPTREEIDKSVVKDRFLTVVP